MTPEFQAHVRCENANCQHKKPIPIRDAIEKTVFVNGNEVTYYFCGTHCMQEHYITHLQASEGDYG